jgi:hypothetical protein
LIIIAPEADDVARERAEGTIVVCVLRVGPFDVHCPCIFPCTTPEPDFLDPLGSRVRESRVVGRVGDMEVLDWGVEQQFARACVLARDLELGVAGLIGGFGDFE